MRTLKVLEQISQQVDPVALAQGELGKTHAHERGEAEMIDQVISQWRPARGGGFFQVPAHG